MYIYFLFTPVCVAEAINLWECEEFSSLAVKSLSAAESLLLVKMQDPKRATDWLSNPWMSLQGWQQPKLIWTELAKHKEPLRWHCFYFVQSIPPFSLTFEIQCICYTSSGQSSMFDLSPPLFGFKKGIWSSGWPCFTSEIQRSLLFQPNYPPAPDEIAARSSLP